MRPSVCVKLYRIAQEAITDAAKHAQARCVQLRLEVGPAEIVMSVEDDGEATGSATKAASPTPAQRKQVRGCADVGRIVSRGGR